MNINSSAYPRFPPEDSWGELCNRFHWSLRGLCDYSRIYQVFVAALSTWARELESDRTILTAKPLSTVYRLCHKAGLLFTVASDDVDLIRAQYRAFIKQVPLLYFILAINTLTVAATHARFGHHLLTIYVPAALCIVTFSRGVWWWRRRDVTVDDSAALRCLQTTNRLSLVIAAGFSAWGLAIYPLGDAYAQGEDVFFLAMSMISCVFCLMHLRSAALIVSIVGVVPFVLFFLFASRGHFAPEAINLVLVATGMVFMVATYNREFADLVTSRRDLARQYEETRRLGAENLRMANIDALTGLSNRRALMARLEQCQDDEQPRTTGALCQTAVMFIDLDGFKDVNDTYGHEIGDGLLKLVARDFEALLPPGALLSRLGGDEFAVLVSAPDVEATALSISHLLISGLNAPLHIGERTIQIGASIGIARAAPQACSANELMRQADVAMYRVKADGKSNVQVYTPALDAERQRRQDIEDEIKDGLKREEFDVEYQPIVDAATRTVVAVEALLRWPRRPAGPLGPDTFIPIAESSGLIHALGQFVLRRACEDLRDRDGVKLSVNVSPAQFRDPGFEARLGEILREGYLINHPTRAAATIAVLKTMGISVALDDFGTGYTSIAYLQTYGFGRIKIDKSLVDGIGIDHKASVLISGIVFLAAGLDMAVTAEGVESEGQATLLRLAGCHCLQGFLFGRAQPIGRLARAGSGAASLAG